MTMISAYLRAEEIDAAEPDSFYHGGQRRRSVMAVYVSDPGTGREVLPGQVEEVPEFYRLLKELSDDIGIEATEDQETFEQLLGL